MKYTNFCARVENPVTGETENIIFGERATVKDIWEVLDESLTDMMPSRVTGMGVISANTRAGLQREVGKWVKHFDEGIF